MCVCYTNHALDQFLEDLMNAGVPKEDMVRLGSSRKISEVIKPLMLRALSGNTPFSKAENRAFRQIKERQIELSQAIRENEQILMRVAQLHWIDISDWLEVHEREAIRSFQLSVGKETVVGKGGKTVTPKVLWKMWRKGELLGGLSSKVKDSIGLWKLSKKNREKKLSEWVEDIRESLADKLCVLIGDLGQARQEMDDLRRGKSHITLAGKRIIGCTTMGATMHWSELQSLNAGVLLVEEAGEILESHIITSLRENTKHLIMIGDHRQLRPKVNSYELTVERGSGFDLNMSLFERLVKNGFPHTTLSQQHRMRPDISNLVRQLTYPALTDAKSVSSYPNLKGVKKNLIFLQHSSEEGGGSIRQVGEGGLSKVNIFEAEMVAKVSQYVLQQGYAASQVVILTPYLGQLKEIRDLLKKGDTAAYLGDQDLAELRQAGLKVDSDSDSGSVRIATIDNYQGEEADVVIVSLVRSNAEGNIGFLVEPERVNVMLSRARHGLIMVGDLKTLCSSKNRVGRELWLKIEDMLVRGGNLFAGLPVICQMHPATERLLESASAFEDFARDGGCNCSCPYLLPCKHPCPRKCHPYVQGKHPTVHCTETVTVSCSDGHPMSFKCFQNAHTSCKRCEKLKREAKLKAKKDAEYAEMIRKKMQEVEDERQKLKEIEDNEQRRIQEEKLKIEIELLKKEQDLRSDTASATFEKKKKALRKEADRRIAEMEKKTSEKSGGNVNVANVVVEKPMVKLCAGELGKLLKDKDIPVVLSVCASWDSLKLAASFGVDPKDPRIRVLSAHETPKCVGFRSKSLSQGFKNLESKDFLGAYALFEKAKSPDANLLCLLCRLELRDDSVWEEPEIREFLDDFASSDQSLFLVELLVALVALDKHTDADEGFAHKCILTALTLLKLCHASGGAESDFGLGLLWSEKTATSVVHRRRSKLCERKVDKKNPMMMEKKWEEEKTVNGAHCVALDEMMKMAGLEKVKETLLNFYYSVQVTKRQGLDLKEKRFSACLRGNPGTGKTTVARIYGRLLAELKILDGAVFEETSGAKLVHGGVAEAKKIVESLEKQRGGVLFIDEAYQLDPKAEIQGKRVLD